MLRCYKNWKITKNIL